MEALLEMNSSAEGWVLALDVRGGRGEWRRSSRRKSVVEEGRGRLSRAQEEMRVETLDVGWMPAEPEE